MADKHERLLASRASEYFREGSVLILVFGVLDPMVQRSETAGTSAFGRLWDRLSASDGLWALLILIISAAAFWGGRKFDQMVDRVADQEKPAGNGHGQSAAGEEPK